MHQKLLGTLLLTLTLCGCGTMDNMAGGPSARVYGGVRQDVKDTAQSTGAVFRAQDAAAFSTAIGTGAVRVLDVPFSVVADTVTLPVTVPAAVRRTQN
jgi:uncharacterized protein YceK